VTTTHLHRDDTPLTLRLLDGLLGHRHDRAEVGYRPDQWGAEVDWDRLTSGVLSTSEVAVIHIAHGCAIAERHGGSLPASCGYQGPRAGPRPAGHRFRSTATRARFPWYLRRAERLAASGSWR
jgi:hypothetical protein